MNKREIIIWLRARLAARLVVDVARIDPDAPMADLGLSSEQSIEIAAELGLALSRPVGAEALYNHPTIASLARYLAEGDVEPVALAQTRSDFEPVAIIGIGCRFPGAGAGPAAFFDFLAGRGDAISRTPAQRWDPDLDLPAVASPTGRAQIQWGGFLDEIDQFDPAFFGVSPAEALHMDPQQRLLLEAAWHALEDAGLSAKAVSGSSLGVFVGVSTNEYSRGRFDDPEVVEVFTPSGSALSIAANRLSYVLDVRGPSVAVDTACSSSLTAVHLACQSLRAGEAPMALAGGVNVLLSPDVALAFSRAGLMAADGRCKPFDDRADGYVRGEGVGLVLLKPLAQAVRDGDDVYAVIRGSAVRQDGRSNGLMAPRGGAQEEVVAAACRAGGISPEQLQYVEAHGTGTALGDVIEARALGQVLGDPTAREACRLGSVKSNIGHLESAAGIAGLIKTALCLHHEELLPSINFARPNRAIPFEALGLEVGLDRRPWPSVNGERLAGVSSFGFGGTNVHVVLGEAPRGGKAPARSGASLALGLSAPDGASLDVLRDRYAQALAGVPAGRARGLLRAATRRPREAHRLAVSGSSLDEVARLLDVAGEGGNHPDVHRGDGARAPRVGLVFSGQGAIWPAAGLDLFKDDAVFRARVLECDAALKDPLGSSVLPAIYSDEASRLLERTEWAQPALFAIQMGLLAVVESWGLAPTAVIGHSAGEVAAACAAGRLSLDEGVRLIVQRSRAMHDAHDKGRMLALAVDEARAEALIGSLEGVELGALNAPGSVVLSGGEEPLRAVEALAQEEGIASHWLPVKYAFHSAAMDEAAARMRELEASSRPSGDRAFYSGVSGGRFEGALDGDYWADNIRRPVRFGQAVGAAAQDGVDLFVEIGPHAVLARDIVATVGGSAQVAASLRRGQAGPQSLARLGAQLFAAGALPSLAGLTPFPDVALEAPPRAWGERSRVWLDKPPPGREPRASAFLTRKIELAWDAGRVIWEGSIQPDKDDYLLDHVVIGEAILPAAAHVDVFLRVATDAFGVGAAVLRDVRFLRPVSLESVDAIDLQVSVDRLEDGRLRLSTFVRSDRTDGVWSPCATADAEPFEGGERPRVSLGAIETRCFDRYPGQLYYSLLAQRGLGYGPRLRVVSEVQARRGEGLASLSRPEGTRLASGRHLAHPALVDGGFHVMASIFGAKDLRAETGGLFIPSGIDEIVFRGGDGEATFSHGVLRGGGSGSEAKADIALLDRGGAALVSFNGFTVRRVQAAEHGAAGALARNQWLYQVDWIDADRPLGETPAPAGPALVFCDGSVLGEALAALWRAAGERCVRLRPGAGFARLSADDYTIDPISLDDLKRVLQEAGVGGWANVIHLWGRLMPEGVPLADDAAGSVATTYGPGALTLLVQALDAGGLVHRPPVTVLTSGAVEAWPGRASRPLAAMAWGLARAAAFEHPDLVIRLVDLDPDTASQEALVDPVWREIVAPDLETQIGLSVDARRVARLVRAAPSAAAQPPPVHADATYLLVGGDGALGRQAAVALVARGARTLVIASRKAAVDAGGSEFPADVRVVHVACDVGDREQVRALFRVLDGLPPLAGVVHAAGVLADDLLLSLDRERLEQVLKPKVDGVLALAAEVEHRSLDFFVLFSSAASIFGSPGQAAYCAANSFLDAFARWRSAMGRKTLSISWGPWSGEGMAGRAGFDENVLVTSGLVTMVPPVVGRGLLLDLAGGPSSHVAVVPFNLQSLVQFYPSNAGLSFFERLTSKSINQIRSDGARERVRSRPDLGIAYAAPRDDLDRAIVSIWQRALGVSGIGIDDDVFSLGGDSVLATQILGQIGMAYQVRPNPQAAFEDFTVRGLAGLVEAELAKLVSEMSEEAINQILSGATV
ncbi:MAG: SDR family NAD(P)-dependent oxidoreductase [Phenylobacterium sp.]|uniref:type I polyketide synthase n=1 Tax=Phenylobacterium sp. TaxID=1871053 RepID=UPI0025E3A1B4|nr:type I polyketide synthase [Phenylobacterium sp.]MCA3708466.1 SDR family NAD(P)-dependent oxidoreductase [Phenylobacterium sp.]